MPEPVELRTPGEMDAMAAAGERGNVDGIDALLHTHHEAEPALAGPR